MKAPVFVSYCLLIVAGLISMHAYFKDSVSPIDALKKRLEAKERERLDFELRAQILASELADYQQHVATVLPEALQKRGPEQAYPLRQLASVAGDGEADALEIERASGLFEAAKVEFRNREFQASNRKLSKLITRFPASAHVAEAHFLLAEGEFQLKDYPASVATIEKMIDLFPENELTGFALLRLGHIFEAQERLEDATDIYRSVLNNFKQPDLIKQANASLKAVSL